MKAVHILNGDSLKSQLQSVLKAELIIARECLIDGNVQGSTSTEFYRNRANFIAGYEGCRCEDYYQKTVPELNKINTLSPGCEVTCWFEDDLFCQANFWYVIHLLSKHKKLGKVFLVRPNEGNEYSFANMTAQELTHACAKRQLLSPSDILLLAELWPLYQQNNINGMLSCASKLDERFPFLLPAIEAQQIRTPDESGLGYPERVLLALVDELSSKEFPVVFREFSKRMAIYSFGDLQVKRMFDRVIKS